MQENLIYVLQESINFLENEIRKMSDDLRYLKRTYDRLIPNSKRKNIIKVENLDEEAFEHFMEVLCLNNRVLYNKILKMDEEGFKLDQKSYNDVNSMLLNINELTRINTAYKQAVREDEFVDKAREIFVHACTYYVDLYEGIEKEKQEAKDVKKSYEYALRNIKKNQILTTSNISSITNLINELSFEEEERKILFDELNNYVKSTKKEKVKNIPTENEIKKHEITYVDDEVSEVKQEQEKEDNFAYNYLVTLKSFDSFNDINAFLNSIKYSCDIKKVIQNVINVLSDSKEDELLKKYLENYMFNLAEEKSIR